MAHRAAKIKVKLNATINRDVACLRALLSKAVEWGQIDKHPLAKLKPLKVDHKRKVRSLSYVEEQRLRTALINRDKEHKEARKRGNQWRSARGYPPLPTLIFHEYADHSTPLVLLSINTGLRRGELFALRWKDINLQRKILTVEGKFTKSGVTRHIPA